jgi:hypothetical protein
MRPLLVLLCVSLVSTVSIADDTLDAALLGLRTAPAAEKQAAVDAVLALDPKPAQVVQKLRGNLPVPSFAPGWHVLQARDAAGVARPFCLYVPKGDHAGPLPLLVYMHGGVSRPDYPTVGDKEGRPGDMWEPSADEHGFLLASPLAKGDCMWWSDAGAGHVRAVIRETKRLAPVDDEAIVGAGFSDGGSGCYYLALAQPDPFAAFLPLNGHPAVAASASGKQLYLRNLKMTPLFCAMTSDDQLYPAFAVLEHLAPVIREGAPIRLVSYETGGHRPVYFEDQKDAFARFLTDTPRDVRQQIDWWCAQPETGRLAWLEVLELGAAAGDADAVEDINVISTPDRVRLGFHPDRTFEGPGVKVTSVVKDTTAEKIGLRKGDVVRELDGVVIATLGDLSGVLARKKHGTPVRVVVRRGEEDVELKGDVPPFTPRPYYAREKPTARISVAVAGDEYTVVSRHVRRFRILVEDDRPKKVTRNGAALQPKVVRYGLKTILERYARDADKGRVYTGELVVELGE